SALGHGDREVEGSGDDGAWASWTRLMAVRQEGATIRRSQDCRTRSVFDAGGPVSSLALAAAESVHYRTPVLLRFSLALPSVTATGRWRERKLSPVGLHDFDRRAIGLEPHPIFIDLFCEVALCDATGRWRERGRMGQ